MAKKLKPNESAKRDRPSKTVPQPMNTIIKLNIAQRSSLLDSITNIDCFPSNLAFSRSFCKMYFKLHLIFYPVWCRNCLLSQTNLGFSTVICSKYFYLVFWTIIIFGFFIFGSIYFTSIQVIQHFYFTRLCLFSNRYAVSSVAFRVLLFMVQRANKQRHHKH